MVYVYVKSWKEIDFSLGRNYIDEEEHLEQEEQKRKEMAVNSRIDFNRFGTFKKTKSEFMASPSVDYGKTMSRMSENVSLINLVPDLTT